MNKVGCIYSHPLHFKVDNLWVTILWASPVWTLVHCVVKYSRPLALKTSSDVSIWLTWMQVHAQITCSELLGTLLGWTCLGAGLVQKLCAWNYPKASGPEVSKTSVSLSDLVRSQKCLVLELILFDLCLRPKTLYYVRTMMEDFDF